MTTVKPALTPMMTNESLRLTFGTTLSDGSEYHSVVGTLQYLHFTCPNIVFAMNKVSQFMHHPTEIHWQVVKCLFQYLLGIKDRDIFFYDATTQFLLVLFLMLTRVVIHDDFTSTSAHIVYIGAHLISWTSRKQKSVSRSSKEVEYRVIADTASKL